MHLYIVSNNGNFHHLCLDFSVTSSAGYTDTQIDGDRWVSNDLFKTDSFRSETSGMSL